MTRTGVADGDVRAARLDRTEVPARLGRLLVPASGAVLEHLAALARRVAGAVADFDVALAMS